MGLKKSFYNFLFTYNENYYIYNTLSTALAQLDKKTYKSIENDSIGEISIDTKERLKLSGFLTDESCNEYEQYLFFYNSVRFGRTQSFFHIVLVPTYNCNLACPYCMQGQNKKEEKMSEDDINRVIEFCKKEIEHTESIGTKVKKINVDLFGGEPTLCKSVIQTFCSNIREYAKEKNISVDYQMTSNFTMIDDSFIDFLKEYEISTQVTIDGTPQHHNERRITKFGKGTYDIIINNLSKMKDRGLKDYITIRINVDDSNIEDAEAIAENMKEYSNDVYFGYLDSYEGKNDDFSKCINECDYSIINTAKLDSILASKGFFRGGRHFGKQAPCSINSINKFFVDCKMDVYKCDMLLNNPDMRVGTIAEDGTFIPEAGYYHQMGINPEKYSKCKSCKILPMCAGGCAGKSYFKNSLGNGRILKEHCAYTEDDLLRYLKSYVAMNAE